MTGGFAVTLAIAYVFFLIFEKPFVERTFRFALPVRIKAELLKRAGRANV
jgi:peptidoglycan/LPS O-acetylase OafA/YrhL